MRCLALAGAWEQRGGESVFAMAEGRGLEQQWKARHRSFVAVPFKRGSREDAAWLRDWAKAERGSAVVLDGYEFSSEYQATVKDSGRRLLTVDDLAKDAPYSADLILNQAQEGAAQLYQDRASYTRLLLGPSFFLLRREFLKNRVQARKAKAKGSRVLVTMGSADPVNATEKVLAGLALIEKTPMEVTVVTGNLYPHEEALKSFLKQSSLKVRWEKNVHDMSQLMAWADCAVSAGGVTCWEMAFMGLPFIGITVADNQVGPLGVLAAKKVAINLGKYSQVTSKAIAQTVADLLKSRSARQHMTENGQQLVDGRGPERVLDQLTRPVEIRPAQKQDSRLIWKWANDPVVRASAFSSAAIPWKNHERWFEGKLNDPNCLILLGWAGGEPFGQVRFDLEGTEAEIDVSTSRTVRGNGFGAQLIEKGSKEFFRRSQADTLHAWIKQDNQGSKRAFEKAGFKLMGNTKKKGAKVAHYTLKRQARPITVLLTGAGGSGTLEIISALKAQGDFRIVGLDASAYSRGLALCDAGYVVPFATDHRFKPAVLEILKKERPDFAIPLVDEEIIPFHELVTQLGKSAPKLITPTKEFCEITLDKWKTFERLQAAGLPTPATVLATEGSHVTFPAVIKPRDGRGSREVAYLKNNSDLQAFLKERTRSADNYIVQRQVFGKEYTVSVVVGLDGKILAVVPKEVVVKKGITQVGVTRKNAVIEKLCRDVQSKLQANGPFNVQLMLQQDGTPTIIEINPRYSTTVALTLASGVDEVGLVMRHALGQKLRPLQFKPDLLMFRYQTQVFMPEGDWPPASVSKS